MMCYQCNALQLELATRLADILPQLNDEVRYATRTHLQRLVDQEEGQGQPTYPSCCKVPGAHADGCLMQPISNLSP